MKKESVIVAGPNGAGKTTLAYEFLENAPEKYVYLSADLIASQLFPEHPERVQFRAGKIFIKQLYEHIEAGENLIVESTLSGKSFEEVAFGEGEKYSVIDEMYFKMFESLREKK